MVKNEVSFLLKLLSKCRQYKMDNNWRLEVITSVCIYMCVYMYTHICVCMYVASFLKWYLIQVIH